MSLVDLQGLIQSIASQRRSGVLAVSTDHEERRLRFANGMIVAISGGPPELLAKTLVWSGVISSLQLSDEMAKLDTPVTPKQLVKHLANGRVLNRDAMLDALDTYIEEEFFTVLAWNDPRMAFNDTVTPELWADVQVKVGVSVSPGSVLLEGLRRQDELGAVSGLIPDRWDLLLRDDLAPVPEEATPDMLLVLEAVSESAIAGRVLDHAQLPPFRATIAIAHLRRHGVLRVAEANELVVQADAAHARGRAKEALGLYRRVVELGLSSARIQLHLGELAERFGDDAAAAAYYLVAAPELSDATASVVALRNALRLGADPEQPLSTLAEVYQQNGEAEQAIITLMELARLRESRGQAETAMQVVREAQNLGADPAESASLLARLATTLGDEEQAMLQLELAARALHEHERDAEAIAAWREMMRRAPGRCEYARECAELLVWTGDRDAAVMVLVETAGTAANAGDEQLIAMYELLARLDPENAEAHDWLAKAYERRRDRHGATAQLRLMLAAQEKAQDWTQLADTLERILELGGATQTDVLTRLAVARARLQQPERAALAWCQAIDAALATEKIKDVRALADTALAAHPSAPDVRLRVAQLANRDGDRAAAARQYQAAADLAFGTGDPTTAREMLLQVVCLKPEDLHVHLRLADAAEAAKSDDVDALLSDAVRLAARTQNHGLALEYARRRIALASASATGADGGLAYPQRQELLELLRLSGDYAGELAAGRQLLNELLELGEFDQAVETLSRLVASHPQNAELVQQLAEVHAALGDTVQALRFYRHAVTLLQIDDRPVDAAAVLDLLAGLADDAQVVDAARDRLGKGQAIDWEKIRADLSQDERRRVAEGIGSASGSRAGVSSSTVRRRSGDSTLRGSEGAYRADAAQPTIGEALFPANEE